MAHYGDGTEWRARIDNWVDRWRDHCLLEDGSLFFADRKAWTQDSLERVIERVLEDPILEGGASFVEKLQIQLAEEDLDTRLLAYEAVAVHLLFPSNVGGTSKRAAIAHVRPTELPSVNSRETEFDAALDQGIGSGGTRFNIARDMQVGFLLRFARAIKSIPLTERRTTVADPWALQALTDDLPSAAEPMRHILLHLLHPQTFERMASGNDKRRISQALGETGDPQNPDRRLLAIRRRIESELPEEKLDFYESPLVERWKSGSSTPGVLAVFVGAKSLTNFELAWTSERRWGFASPSADTQAVQPGDLIVFAEGIPNGPRQPVQSFRAARFDRVAVGRVTTSVSTDTARVWPTETGNVTAWPEILEFEPMVLRRDVEVATMFSTGLADAMRQAGIVGHPIRLAGDPSPILTESDIEVDPPKADISAAASGFIAAVEHSDLVFGDQDLPKAFLAALLAKRFVLLAGLSGSGKTQLARRLGQWFSSANAKRYEVVPVRPDWTSPDAVLGYEDALAEPEDDGRRPWHAMDVLKVVRAATDDPGAPYLLVLDEMNLAHVERYFADFLSGIESGERVIPNVRAEDDGRWRLDPDGPAAIAIPQNLFIVGTVNIDETTFSFSPKVLDRAFVFEFDVPTSELTSELRPLNAAPAGNPAHLEAVISTSRDSGWHVNNAHPEQDEISQPSKPFTSVYTPSGWGSAIGPSVSPSDLPRWRMRSV